MSRRRDLMSSAGGHAFGAKPGAGDMPWWMRWDGFTSTTATPCDTWSSKTGPEILADVTAILEAAIRFDS